MLEQYTDIQNRRRMAAQGLALAEIVLKNFEADLRSQVQMYVGGNTITLVFDGRELKCVKNSHNRLRVSENKKVIDSDFLGNIRDLRLLLAIGEF